MEPMEREPIVDDQVFKVSFADNVDYLSPNYDKIDFFPGFGHYILKVVQEDGGVSGYHITEGIVTGKQSILS